MRISDWSSDVCSSDLVALGAGAAKFNHETLRPADQFHWLWLRTFTPGHAEDVLDDAVHALALGVDYLDHAPVSVGEFGFFQQLRRVTDGGKRSEEHTSELQSLMRISYAVFCLKKTKQ